jgi:hypothetical protein
MSVSYKLVSSKDIPLDDASASPPARPRRNYWAISLGSISLANVCLLIATLYFWRAAWHAGGAAPATPPSTITSTSTLHTHDFEIPESLASVDALPIAYVPFRWNTPWGAPNASDADQLWDNINTAHGHIAVDHTWAAENNVSSLEYRCANTVLDTDSLDSGLLQ